MSAEILAARELARRVLEGMSTGREYQLIADRKLAIQAAIGMALPGDVVLLAGKGHETVQIVGHQRLPHDEIAIARSALG